MSRRPEASRTWIRCRSSSYKRNPAQVNGCSPKEGARETPVEPNPRRENF